MAVPIMSGSGTQYPLIINPDGSLNTNSIINLSGLSSLSSKQYPVSSITTGTQVGMQDNIDSLTIQNIGSGTGLWYYLNGSISNAGIVASGGYIGMLDGISFDLQLTSGANITLASESGTTSARILTLYG